MNRSGDPAPAPRSSSMLSMANCSNPDSAASISSSSAFPLGINNLPFSARKFPGKLLPEQAPIRHSIGSKVKGFFLSSQPEQLSSLDKKSDTSVSNVQDLILKYGASTIEPILSVDEDCASVVENNGSIFQSDNISFSSMSNLSNITDFSTEPCASTLTNATLNSSKLQVPGLALNGMSTKPSSDLEVPPLNRSYSASDTCQSQDSGYVDEGKSPRNQNDGLDNESGDKKKGFASLITKGLFSKLINPEQAKPKLNQNTNKSKKSDEFMTKTTQTWLNDIIPQWDRGSRRWRQTHELWWLGLPPKVRGQVWSLAVGNDLHITEDLYKICLDRAACVFQHLGNEKAASDATPPATLDLTVLTKPGLCNYEQIVRNTSTLPVADKPLLQSLPSILLDLSRTFPQLGLFQEGGPMHESLKNLLSAYTSYRPDVGYVQGMSFIASVLLLNMDEFDAFVIFTNLINRPLHLAMFSVDRRRIGAYVATFKKMLWALLPELAGHFAAHRLSPDVYLFEWLLPIYCKSFSLDVVSRIWDIYIRDGENFLFKVALGILKQNEASLLNSDFDQMVAILANIKAQADLTAGEQLFVNIQAVSKTKVSSSEAFSKILEESLKEDADRWCESSSD